MGKMRVTVTIDEHLAAKVRQMFGGNLSKGVNELLQKAISARAKKKSMYGILKGVDLLGELKRMDAEESEAEKEHDALYR